MADASTKGSSPYATGGGGVTLEHAYAACLISAMLAGEALTELGDGSRVDSIRLQASDVSVVDDIVLEGRDDHGVVHRASIGVRRDPRLTRGDDASVPLVRAFLSIVTSQWAAVSAGRWQLVLAVSTDRRAVGQLADLAGLARSLPNAEQLKTRLAQAGRTRAAVRSRYEHVEGLVGRAAKTLDAARDLSQSELTWRFLWSLSVKNLRLERTDQSDRTIAVNALRRTLHQGTHESADALFTRVAELTRGWAAQGAVVTQGVARRQLSDHLLDASPAYGPAWSVLDRLGDQLRDSIPPALRTEDRSLELQRGVERDRLLDAFRIVGQSPSALVVSGDPDVGKSALALRVAEQLKSDGGAVIGLSVRDLPPSLVELESVLGGARVEGVMGAGPVRPVRLVLLDGAESVLEGKADTLRTVAKAALTAGVGVVAVTRRDGEQRVREVLQRACQLAEISPAVNVHSVESLTEDECDQIAAAFIELHRLRGDPRSAWLLRRLGLVDAVLRTGETVDPSELLCEADVFSAVWAHVVRGDEQRVIGTASADDREQAALAVAARALGLPAATSTGTATAELRSDGLLRVPRDHAFAATDEFASDLFRDFALARLFLSSGWDALAQADAPRWAIRAARIACQATLSQGEVTDAWARLQSAFGDIATAHGSRWLDVAHEALITSGDASSAIRGLWDDLNEDDGVGVTTLLRCAQLRYADGHVSDGYALAPVVEVAFAEGRVQDVTARIGHDSANKVVQELVLAWLRDAALRTPAPDLLRQRVRDAVLSSQPEHHDPFAVEALALLGTDLNDAAAAWLRDVAQDHPFHLREAVESHVVAIAMAATQPQLLLQIAEAYYIDKPHPDDLRASRGIWDDGVRDGGHGGGLGGLTAAWYHGPFYRLLQSTPVEAIGFINRMLDHAGAFRVRGSVPDTANGVGDLPGIRLDLLGFGDRLYVGDRDVWAWYRGTTVGPYPCMSALLALERFCDHLLETLKLPVRGVMALVLHDCHNLAVVGMLAGVLFRHAVTDLDLLAPLLVTPHVWYLETSRVTAEHGFRVRDIDADLLTGNERRALLPQQQVGELVVKARLAGDVEQLERLEAVGAALVENGRRLLAGTDDGDTSEQLAEIENWAAMFRIDNYQAEREGSQVLVGFERPADVERALAPRSAELAITNKLYGLQNRYAVHNRGPAQWPTDSLIDDLAAAREINGSMELPASMYRPEDALVAVAAAAVRAHATQRLALPAADLAWAAEAVLLAAENPRIDSLGVTSSFFPMGADRAAAAAAPTLVLAPLGDIDLDPTRVASALHALATNTFDEVRSTFVIGALPVWESPCNPRGSADPCRLHAPVWNAAVAGLSHSRLGPWNVERQRREADPLPDPFHESLETIADDSLLVNQLRSPLACMVDARQVSCLGDEISALWIPLWDAHRRGLGHGWTKGYDHCPHQTHLPIARRMIQVALSGDHDPARSHIEAFATAARPLELLFDGFASAFTYDDALRHSIGEFWPWAMRTALDVIGDGTQLRSDYRWFDNAVAALLPTPRPRPADTNLDDTLARCRQSWIDPGALDGTATPWLSLARGKAKSVDAVISLARTAPFNWQATTALAWVEQLVGDQSRSIANHLWHLETWLETLRERGLIIDEIENRYHRVVDALAAAGDRSAVRLQKLDE